MQIWPCDPLTLILFWLLHYQQRKNLNSQACLQVPSCSGSYTSSGLISHHSTGASWVNSTIPKHAETITFLGFCSCCVSAWILLLSFLCLANSYACTRLSTGLFFRLCKSLSAWWLPQGCPLQRLVKFTKVHLKTRDRRRKKRMKYLPIRSYIFPNSLCISPNNTKHSIVPLNETTLSLLTLKHTIYYFRSKKRNLDLGIPDQECEKLTLGFLPTPASRDSH